MRILLLSKADLFGNIILNRLLPILSPLYRTQVCLSDKIFPDERGNPWSDAYMHFSRDYLLDTFFPALDRLSPDGDGGAEFLSFAALSRRHGVPLTELGEDHAAAMAILDREARAFRPDVLFCCRHDFIIPESIYSRASGGAYNMHSGALPAYRGPFCSFWAMRNGDREAACTLHTLKRKVDTGDTVGMGKVPLDYGRPLLSNLVDIYLAGVDVFLELLPKMERAPMPGIPQPRGAGRYYPQPDAADCEDFVVRKGRSFVDGAAYSALLGRYLGEHSLAETVGDSLPVPPCGEKRTT